MNLRISILIMLTFGIIVSCLSYAMNYNAEIETKGRVYYIDSEKGDDANELNSIDLPWKSLDKLNKMKFLPGDEILFKRGSSYTGVFIINDSGKEDLPIKIGSYGSEELPQPAFTNAQFNPQNSQFGNCIRIKGSYIIVENLYFHHTVADLPTNAGGFLTMWELGAIYIDKNARYCTVRNNEIFDCGVGIKSYGAFAKIQGNYIHDCNRVLKKWNWGPIAIWLGGDHQEVSYNKIFNYSAVNANINWGPNAYGCCADGSAIEIDDARFNKHNILIHHNYTRNCQGFLEVTWTDVEQNPEYKNFLIHHNISDDYQQFIALWRGEGCRIENNTIIRKKINENEWGVFNITQHNSKNIIRNNIVVVEDGVCIFNLGRLGNARPSTIIENNLYWAASGELDIGLEGPGKDAIISDPHFLNYSNGMIPLDFALRDSSCAIDAGLNLNYSVDFIGNCIPNGKLPDIGAFEF